MVSKACHVAVYRKKLECLASFPDVDLIAVIPPHWRGAPFEPGYDRGYRTIIEEPALNGHFHLHFYPGLGRIVRETRPDIMHIDEEPYDLVTFLALKTGIRYKVKCLFFTWQNIKRRFPPPFSWFEKTALSNSQTAIAGNQEAKSILLDKGFRNPVHVIPQFGVDTDLFNPDSKRPETEEFNIGYAGRLVPEKGLSVLLNAVSRLAGRWRLVLIGDGPLKEKLKSAAKDLGIQDKVTFAGPAASVMMPKQLSQLDLLVLPSLTTHNWKEQFGRVLIEAMACGVPVIGSNSGEIPNVIGNAGLIFPEGDAPALRNTISSLMDNEALRKQLSEDGRRRVEEEYSQSIIAKKTYQAYKELIQR